MPPSRQAREYYPYCEKMSTVFVHRVSVRKRNCRLARDAIHYFFIILRRYWKIRISEVVTLNHSISLRVNSVNGLTMTALCRLVILRETKDLFFSGKGRFFAEFVQSGSAELSMICGGSADTKNYIKLMTSIVIYKILH